MTLSSCTAFSTLVSRTLVSGVLATGSIFSGAIAPAQAAATLFTEAAVQADSFLVMAAPRMGNAYNLVVVEQKTNQRACWQDNGNGTVEPLLLNFDFSGICGRSTDSNGYSIRMGGEDLGLSYSLRLVDRGNHVALVGTPSSRNATPVEIGRTQATGANYLAVKLNPGWELSRRVYDGKPLGHMYFSNSAPGTLAQTPKLPPAVVVVPKPPTTPPSTTSAPGAVVGTPLPKPPVTPVAQKPPVTQTPVTQTPVTQKPVDPKPVIVQVLPKVEPTTAQPPATTPVAQAPKSPYVHQAKLNALYTEILGRNIDPAGLHAYNAELESGKSMDWMRRVLVNSSEYKAMKQTTLAQMKQNPSYTTLNAIYLEVLGRNVDALGLETYGPKLEKGKRGAWVRDRLAKTEEGRAVAIDRSYKAILGRSVDPSGMNTYLGKMEKKNWSVAKVQRVLSKSDEAKLAKLAKR